MTRAPLTIWVSARLARGLEPQIKARVHFALSLDMVGVGARLAVRGIEGGSQTAHRRSCSTPSARAGDMPDTSSTLASQITES